MPETGRCPTCLMRHDAPGLAGVPFCDICRDQVQDFLVVSIIGTVVWAFAQYNLWYYILQEVAFLVVLIFLRHRAHPWFRRRS